MMAIYLRVWKWILQLSQFYLDLIQYNTFYAQNKPPNDGVKTMCDQLYSRKKKQYN